MATGGSTLNRFYPAVANSTTLSFRRGVTHIRKAPENVSFAIRLGNVSKVILNANILPQQSTARYGFSSFAKPENTPWVYSRAPNQSIWHLVWTDTSFLCRSAPDPYSTGVAQLGRRGDHTGFDALLRHIRHERANRRREVGV